LAFVRHRKLTLALEVVEQGVRRFPKANTIRAAQIRVLWAAGKNVEALAAAKKLAQSEASLEHDRLHARAAILVGDGDRAMAIIRDAQARHPGSFDFLTIEALIIAKKLASAEAHAKRLTEELAGVRLATAFDVLARIYRLRGLLHKAKWARDQALRLRTLP